MPSVVILALAVALAATALLARPRYAFTALISATVLLPTELQLPFGAPSFLRLHLITALAAFGGLLYRTLSRRNSPSVWRPTGAMLGLGVYLVVVAIVGFGLAAPGVEVAPAIHRLIDLNEQLLVLIVSVALVREDGKPMDFVLPIVGVMMVSVGIGFIEHFTSHSWGAFLLKNEANTHGASASQPLQLRAGKVRVRAGADYSVAYAAVLVTLIPMLLVLANKAEVRGRVGCVIAGAATLLAIYWSGTRSALLDLAVVLVVVAVLARRKRIAAISIVVLVAGGIAVLFIPSISHHFSLSIDQGSADSRTLDLAQVLSYISGRPFIGYGLTGLSLVGLGGLNSTYTLVYGETGALGLGALAGSFAVVVWNVARGLKTRDEQTRLLIAASVAGVVALIVAGLALDSVDLPTVINVLWEIAAVGLVAGELSAGPARLLRPIRSLAALTVAFGVVGGIVAIFAPVHYATVYQFTTLPESVQDGPDNVTAGDLFITTACEALDAEATQLNNGIHVACRNPFQAEGEGDVRLQAPTAQVIDTDVPKLVAAARRSGIWQFGMLAETDQVRGRPTGMTTLPGSLGIFGFIVALGAPLTKWEKKQVRPIDIE